MYCDDEAGREDGAVLAVGLANAAGALVVAGGAADVAAVSTEVGAVSTIGGPGVVEPGVGGGGELIVTESGASVGAVNLPTAKPPPKRTIAPSSVSAPR